MRFVRFAVFVFLFAAAAVAAPVVSINDVNVTEGNSGTTNAVFTVTITGTRASDVTVNWYTYAGTALSGIDYQHTTGVLTFTPSDTQKTLTVPVYGDTAYEPNEYFYVYI